MNHAGEWVTVTDRNESTSRHHIFLHPFIYVRKLHLRLYAKDRYGLFQHESSDWSKMSRKTQDHTPHGQNVTKNISWTKCHTENASRTKCHTDKIPHGWNVVENDVTQRNVTGDVHVCMYVTYRPYAFRFATEWYFFDYVPVYSVSTEKTFWRKLKKSKKRRKNFPIFLGVYWLIGSKIVKDSPL